MDFDNLQKCVAQLIFSHFSHPPTQGQQIACQTLIQFLYDTDSSSTALLRGYAGTGKTTLVSAIIQTAPQLNLKTILMAPTGRAAKVLSNYSGKTAYTIHKKIYTSSTDNNGRIKTVRAPNKHSHTLFIIDEASMIDNTPLYYPGQKSLLLDLIDYVRSGNQCRMLLIGDTAQLPPVGTEQSDALDADYLTAEGNLKIFETELTEVVRQELASGILANATHLRRQITNIWDTAPIQLPLFQINGHNDILRLTGEDLEETLHREYDEHGEEDVVVICRSNKRANLYNEAIRNRVLYRDNEIGAGDLLMVVKNNYYWSEETSGIGFIANGDIAEVLSVRGEQELYGHRFADASLRFIDYPDAPTLECKLLLTTLHSEGASLTDAENQQLFNAVMEDYADLPTKADRMRAIKKDPYYNTLQVKFAYALTCHKTQGGQWNTVIVEQGYITEDQMNKSYLRWLYTAITRATQRVYLLNFQEHFFEQ
ncbi:MAG: AAA family ATPase [Bacteroidales bacterium]|nr:AAA family ATPase [Candidatus Colimorpha onthohippi]